MRYHNITHDDMLNGDGLRVVLWVSGCSHKCKGCHNPDGWEFSNGTKYTSETESMIIEALSKPYIKGLSLLGGEPFDQPDLY